MRILVLTHNYPRFAGDPAGAFVQRIARVAATRHAEVAVLAPHAAGLAIESRDEGVALHRFRYAPDSLERVAYTGDLHRRAFASPLYALAVPLFLRAFLRSARRLARDFRPDVVHAHWWFPAGWVASRLDRPYVVTCHGSDVRLLERGAFMRRIAAPVFARAGAVTAVSRFLARDIERLLALPADRVRPLAMPVDLAHFASGNGTPRAVPPRLLYAGNLVPSKGVDVLLQAYARLRREGLDCRLRVLGEGPAESELRALALRLAANDVEWSRFLPQDRMPGEYGAASIVVLPTRGQAEGLGLSLVEATAAGAAVVGTPAGGIPEVVLHEQTGLLVPDGDPVALAAALARLLTDEPLRRRLIAAGQERITAVFGRDQAIAPFLALYDEVAGHHPH